MRLHTPNSLAYPITVTTVRCRPHDQVAPGYAMFVYKYRTTQTVHNEDGEEKPQELFAEFQSEAEGKVMELAVRVGQTLTKPTFVADIQEPCKHDIQFGGMCADCGRDMTHVSYNQSRPDTERATISSAHEHTALKVSHDEATRAEDDAKRRLLNARKLSLVVDLDQTIIHATFDPTVADWQADPENPNHDAVRNVRRFQLKDHGPGSRGTWYYIKLRPGLRQFLQHMSRLYEMHIYTMATQAYAHQVAELVDPDHKLFASRILSRDTSGSMSCKNLSRLFPVDTNMVVVIDDRGDVWDWTPNLIKVVPYEFFVGIGDINSSFLPKRQETAGKKENKDESEAKDEAERVQAEAIAEQVADRPLLKKQKRLESEQAEQEETQPQAPERKRHLLQDHDTELQTLGEALQRVHDGFFAEYDRLNAARSQGAQVAEVRRSKSPKPEQIPHAADIVVGLKHQVLADVRLIFSGVIPLDVELEKQEIYILATSFGAEVDTQLSSKTTHVIAIPERKTSKVRQAARKGIEIVGPRWLLDCISAWKKLDEAPYRIHEDIKAEEVDGLEAATPNPGPDSPPEKDEALPQSESPPVVENQEDWSDIDGDLAEFLGSEDGSDSDSEDNAGDDDEDGSKASPIPNNVAETTSPSPSPSAKRKRKPLHPKKRKRIKSESPSTGIGEKRKRSADEEDAESDEKPRAGKRVKPVAIPKVEGATTVLNGNHEAASSQRDKTDEEEDDWTETLRKELEKDLEKNERKGDDGG
ncbi:hypothetical protein K470DRAFT_281109 [Piedraia hortae CBS 480.64]|uniref:RNA polymerase II subunit A C-terminal domain phosphatase n=1 Tax=Piedraia hortae CBS 480.64 TaxID=1314780 RepID=A0A6A7C6F1_9PEZI|nr:hypothetical protein K470DRAFT_281109 [Piedraia hortae CBS 480.64]